MFMVPIIKFINVAVTQLQISSEYSLSKLNSNFKIYILN